MTKNEHTPGPWKYSDAYHESQVDIREAGGKRIAVAVCDFPRTPATMEANAHLIAAAPELLAALEEVVELLRDGYLLFDDDAAEFSIDHWRKAIGKARGEQ